MCGRSSEQLVPVKAFQFGQLDPDQQMQGTMGETVNFIWIGEKLGPLHAACIRSFRRHGHRTVLHAFDAPKDTPDGVEIFDASQLLSQSEIVAYKYEKSLALTANIYRYRLLEAGLGIYADCDVYCVRPFPEQQWLFGWEKKDVINCAVLKAPADSDLVKSLVQCTSGRHFIAPWWSPVKKAAYNRLMKLGFGRDIRRTRWGTTGPQLLTFLIKKYGLADRALPMDAFYPVHQAMTDLLFDAELSIKDVTTPRTYAIHLYNNSIAPTFNPPPGSPLAEILAGT
ncbi:Subversion of eukaryotic vesicle trafficking A [Aminobacter sp. MSH1]|nr:Subversion of eukaryotic vesicle trafficking A [Aminobacter sp. MSH1]